MDVVSIRRRPAALTAVALLALVVASGAAARPEGTSTVRFGSMPRQLVKGELAAVTAAVTPARASCTLSAGFADGRRRSLGAARAVGGHAGIRAGSTYYLGGFANIPEGIAVTRLEVNFRHGQAPRGTLREPPTEDLRITPQIGDPAFVGAVQGQVLNDHPRYLLGNAKVSIVVFDAAGNVTGGTQAFSSAVLLPGARSYFSGSGGVNSGPIANAVTARTTVEPTYAAG